MKDEKAALILRIRDGGGTFRDAVNALHEYMHDKDSFVTLRWCERFAWKIWKEADDDTEDE
ncbi:hypothetical protein FBQ81_03400 [Chloroflexi bacterium CFX6]|nr:hypothetical protein [Chloroflexi bacterium CFX6]